MRSNINYRALIISHQENLTSFIDFLLRRSCLILSTNLASFGSVKINCVDIVHVLLNLLILQYTS